MICYKPQAQYGALHAYKNQADWLFAYKVKNLASKCAGSSELNHSANTRWCPASVADSAPWPARWL
jgi:hypothetical protein